MTDSPLVTTSPTPVVFRIWRRRIANEDVVFALFPTEPSDSEGLWCTTYTHIGQHGQADYNFCIANSRTAKTKEYKALKKELQSSPYFYKLKVCARASKEMHLKRIEAAKEK